MKRAVVVGLDYFAKFMADLINEHSSSWRFAAYDSSRVGTLRALFALRRADALICFGGPSPNSALTEAARRRNIPVFVIWAGSDVSKAQEDPFSLEIIKQEGFVHLAVAHWLIDELRELGVESQYIPASAVRDDPVVLLPRDFRVLTYLPEPRRDFYGARLVYDVARAMPDVRFTVVGKGGQSPDAPQNVEFLGYIAEMTATIDASTVLLRQPQHDGKSMLVLETLSRGRHVVWNYDLPGVNVARGEDAVLQKLQELRALHDAGELQLNTGGREYVLSNFRRDAVAGRIEDRLELGLREHRSTNGRATRRVAISGLGLFCAEMARNVKQFSPEWEPRVMRTSSRLEVLTAINTILWCDVWYSIGSPITDRWVHLVAMYLRKPHVVHWVGSDIAYLSEYPSIRNALASPSTSHLAEVEWTAAQLRDQGFQARIAPLPPRHKPGGARPFPEKFTVMLYVPRTRADFYGRQSFKLLMRRLADKSIRYVVVGGGEIDAPDGVAVENLGWRDNLHSAYENATVLIRNTPRDGLSLMVLEALSYGRYVLWTQDFPHTREIHSYSDMEREIRALYAEHERGILQPQVAAAEMIGSRYAPERCTKSIAQAWTDAVASGVKTKFAMEAP